MKNQKEKITKQDFITYQKVQFSGLTNMFDIKKVSELSKLSREKIFDIIKNYSAYAKKWN